MHSSSGSEIFRLELDEPTPEIDLGSGQPLGLRGTLCRESQRPAQPAGGTGTGQPVVNRHRPTVEQMREQLIRKAIGWVMSQMGLNRQELIAHLAGDKPASLCDSEAALVALADEIRSRKRPTLTKAEHARRMGLAEELLRDNPTMPGETVAKRCGVSRSVVSRLVKRLWPEGRLVIHGDGRTCHRGGQARRRAS